MNRCRWQSGGPAGLLICTTSGRCRLRLVKKKFLCWVLHAGCVCFVCSFLRVSWQAPIVGFLALRNRRYSHGGCNKNPAAKQSMYVKKQRPVGYFARHGKCVQGRSPPLAQALRPASVMLTPGCCEHASLSQKETHKRSEASRQYHCRSLGALCNVRAARSAPLRTKWSKRRPSRNNFGDKEVPRAPARSAKRPRSSSPANAVLRGCKSARARSVKLLSKKQSGLALRGDPFCQARADVAHMTCRFVGKERKRQPRLQGSASRTLCRGLLLGRQKVFSWQAWPASGLHDSASL